MYSALKYLKRKMISRHLKFSNAFIKVQLSKLLKYSPQYEEGMSDDEILAAHGILSYSQTLEWKGAVEYCPR